MIRVLETGLQKTHVKNGSLSTVEHQLIDNLFSQVRQAELRSVSHSRKTGSVSCLPSVSLRWVLKVQ